jgi:hypothetical protein
MIDPIIENRFKELPSSYRDFVASEFPQEIAEVFASSLNLTPDQTDILENGLILYLLFFFTQAELVEYVINNTGADAVETEAVISTICKNLPDFADNTDYEEARHELAEANSSLNSDIAETENALRSIEGLRTMAGDASVAVQAPVNTYQSSQTEILTRSEEQADPEPTVLPLAPPTNTPPRWGSE